MASTQSPTSTSSESPKSKKGKDSFADIFNRATSDFLSLPISSAMNSRLSFKLTKICEASSTT